MNEGGHSFVRAIVDRFPSLGGLLEEHIKDNVGEVLPHVFFGELTRHVLALLASGRHGDDLVSVGELRGILDYLEEAYSAGDEQVRELISVSFLENLPRAGQEGSGIREMVGPSLRRQLNVTG